MKKLQRIAEAPFIKLHNIVALSAICISLTGCGFSNVADKEKTESVSNTEFERSEDSFTEVNAKQKDALQKDALQKDALQKDALQKDALQKDALQKDALQKDALQKDALQKDALDVNNTIQEDAAWNETQSEEGMIYNNSPLYSQKKEDKVCIKVQPSVIRDQVSYYYIPTGEVQEKLSQLVSSIQLQAQPFDYRWKGRKESGWSLHYQDLELMAFDGGYLYSVYQDQESNSTMEYFIQNQELHEYIQSLLKDSLNYKPFDITMIKDIVSAKLEIQNRLTDWELCSQTITDKETLNTIADMFRNAEYVYGGADCGNQSACLELEMTDGETVKMSIATDSCTIFGINGVYYDYRPAEYRKKGSWRSDDFFQYFDEMLVLLQEVNM